MLDITHMLIYNLLHGFPNLRHSAYWATVNKDSRVSEDGQTTFPLILASVLEGSSYNFKDMSFHTQMFCNYFLLFKSPLTVWSTQELLAVLRLLPSEMKQPAILLKRLSYPFFSLKNFCLYFSTPISQISIQNWIKFLNRERKDNQAERQMQNSLNDSWVK